MVTSRPAPARRTAAASPASPAPTMWTRPAIRTGPSEKPVPQRQPELDGSGGADGALDGSPIGGDQPIEGGAVDRLHDRRRPHGAARALGERRIGLGIVFLG